MFVITLLLGIAVGYSLGYKSEKTLKQQISKLKSVVKSQNKSAQLKALTETELRERKDFDFVNKLASITGNNLHDLDTRKNDDLESIDNTF